MGTVAIAPVLEIGQPFQRSDIGSGDNHCLGGLEKLVPWDRPRHTLPANSQPLSLHWLLLPTPHSPVCTFTTHKACKSRKSPLRLIPIPPPRGQVGLRAEPPRCLPGRWLDIAVSPGCFRGCPWPFSSGDGFNVPQASLQRPDPARCH